MFNLFNEINLVIFDLDGTLYEDTDHFDYYAELLMKQLPNELHHIYMEEYQKMVQGNHIATIGKVYDVERDHILEIDPMTLKVQQAWRWEGEAIHQPEEIYPDPLKLDLDNMIAIGDGWWLPNVCAKHFGAPNTQDAYNKTKEFMATDQFQITKIPGLRDALLSLKEKKELVLVTNSLEDDVERLLGLLDLRDIFAHIVTAAKKPQNTKEHFSTLVKEYKVKPEETISIGDNYINEIAPALNLGMKTIFIDFYNLDYPNYSGKKVKSISEIISDMKNV